MLEKLPRPLKWLIAAVGGVVIGAVTTPLAQASVDVGSVTIPWGLVLSLIVVTAYVLGLRFMSDRRLLALFGAVGVVVVNMLLSLPGPGGGVIVPGNLVGTLWAALPSLIFVVIIALPAPRRR